MSTPAHQPASGGASPSQAHASASGTGPFVINLCSSTTPMALTQPQLAELKRFTFFVSRRLEDRRERFRLHMGYFATLPEAEEWLGIVREVYPGAWAGEAPGKRLRAQAAAGAAAPAPARPSAPPPAPPVARAAAPLPPVARPAAMPPLGMVPTLRAAPAAPPAPVAARARPAPVTPRAAPRAQPPKAPNTAARSVAAARGAQLARPGAAPAARTAAPAAPAPRSAPKAPPRAAAPVPPPARPSAAALKAPAGNGSNVRQVLSQLDETGATRQMPAPVVPRVPPSRPESSISDSQVLRILEERRADGARNETADTGISLLRPEDTGTRRAIKDAVVSNAPVAFAVQLNWSVQPIELATVPPLAIFSAYTLYSVEGSREGRRWYGLRLGFFSDAISAKQVAYYVRSEFATVAVVPVSPQERERASAAIQGSPLERRAPLPVQDRLPTHATSEFKLFDDTSEEPKLPQAPAPAAAPPARAPSAKRGGRSQGGKVRAREKRAPQTLEETLEILGADDLEIDNGRGERLNDTGVRHLKVAVKKDTPFARLLDRLSDRVNRG